MRMGQGVRTGFGHGGITCVLQTQFSSFFFLFINLICNMLSIGCYKMDNSTNLNPSL